MALCVLTALKSKPDKGNVPGKIVYDGNGTRVVLDSKTNEIATVTYKGKDEKKAFREKAARANDKYEKTRGRKKK